MVLTFFSTNGTDTTSSIWDTIIKKFLRLVAVYNQCKEAANGARPSISNLTTALIQSKVQAEGAEGATNKLSLSMLLLRARAILLNAALSAGIGFALSWITKKFVEYSQRIDTAATKSKEAADAAQSTTSSLKDLVSAYEELGDKSGWDTEDFDQAKDIQAEILDLAKEQRTLDENKLGKLDLQNGKYEEQLGLLQDITAEQLEASRYELTQNKDAQGDKLVDTAKKNNRTHYLTVWSAPEMDMGDQIKNAGIDVFNKFGGYGPDKLNDADSIVDYYNEVGKALKYIIDNTTEAERAAGGTYHSLYQFLLDEQTALRDDVDSYNDSTDAINNNTNARRKLQAVDFWSDGKSNGMDVSFTFDKVNSAVQTLEDTIDGFDASKLNELLLGTNEGLSDAQAQALANLRKALTDMDFSADTNGVNAFTFKSMVISEDASVDYGQIHNCVEVWGASNSSDYFCKDKLEKNDPDGTGEVVYCKKGTKEWNDVVTLLKDNKLNMSYNMNPNDTGASILLLKLKQASIQDGTRFSFICPEDIAINARICVENLVTTIKTNPTGAGQYRETTRTVYGPMMLFKAVTNEKGEDEPEDTSLLRKGRYYVIKYGEHWLNQATDGAFTYKFNALTGKYEKEQRDPQVRYYPKQIYNPSTKNYDTVYVKYNPATNTEIQISDPALLIESRVYFIGQSQSHAMTKFVDAMPTAKQIEADKIAEACDNLEYVVVNDPNRIDDLYNSRLTIDKIGRRNLVCSGSEFDGYTSDESAMTVCKYTLWKNCRLTDSITLSMHMIPWLDVNEKVKYAAKYLKSDIAVEWIIKKIDKNIGEGTMNVTLSRYYPYYPYITYENVLKEKYIDNKKDT